MSRRYEIGSIGPATLLDMGHDLRERAVTATSPRALGGLLVDFLFESLVDQNAEPACALARFYRTRSYADLHERERSFARRLLAETVEPDDQMRCLCLDATRGVQESWNDPARSAGHLAIPLPSVRIVERLPMVAQLVRQLGLEVHALVEPSHDVLLPQALRRLGVFHVAQAEGSPYIPAQRDFVRPFGIRSVVGFGGVLPDGELFCCILFVRQPVSEATAQHLALLAAYAKLELTRVESPTDAPAALRVRIAALEEVLELQERVGSSTAVERQLGHFEREVGEHNEALRRTQRAMLSVIEDLREAKSSLEGTVAERTSELREQARRLARLNEELTARNAELEQFAYAASHDLQEPLRTITAYLELLERRVGEELDEETREILDFAVGGAERMRTLVRGLLDFSRVTTKAGAMESIDLDKVVNEVITDLGAQIAESEAKVTRADLPTLHGDPVQLHQLFLNLISNALKFCGDAPPRIEIRAVPEGPGDWRVTVCDHGIGFDPRFKERIFQLFRRLTPEADGTGVGLAICKRIVERHGGRIEADSEPGRGASFHVVLPVRAPEEASVS